MQNQISIGSCNRELPQPPRFTIHALSCQWKTSAVQNNTVTLDLGKLSSSPFLRARDLIEGVYSNLSGDVFWIVEGSSQACCLFDVDTMAVCLAWRGDVWWNVNEQKIQSTWIWWSPKQDKDVHIYKDKNKERNWKQLDQLELLFRRSFKKGKNLRRKHLKKGN